MIDFSDERDPAVLESAKVNILTGSSQAPNPSTRFADFSGFDFQVSSSAKCSYIQMLLRTRC